MEWRSCAVQDSVCLARVYGSSDEICVDLVFGVIVVAERDDAVDEVRRDILVKSILKSVFEFPRAWKICHRGKQRMGFAHGASQVLGGEELEMLVYLEHLSLTVEMVKRRHLQRAGGNAQAGILYCIGRHLNVGGPNGSRIIHLRPNEGLVGDEQGLRVLSPRCASQSFHDLQTFGAALGHFTGMWREREMRIKSDTENLWLLCKREDAVKRDMTKDATQIFKFLHFDLRVVMMLMRIRREECDA